jgi:endonuclease G
MVCALFGLGLACLAPLDRPALAQTPANDPTTCRELWEQVGIPQYARDDGRDSTIVCHTKYVLSHNNVTKTPDWVLERLTRGQISGEFNRPSQKFRPDPSLAEGRRAVDADYDKSRFDRGHQAASDDFSTNKDWMVESFFLSNAVPQVGLGFNRGIWKKLEELTRDLARGRGEIYVITGPTAEERSRSALGATCAGRPSPSSRRRRNRSAATRRAARPGSTCRRGCSRSSTTRE